MTQKGHKIVGGVLEVDPDLIKPSPVQPRRWFNSQTAGFLAGSMETFDQQDCVKITPYYGKPDGKTLYYIVDGERRWRAAKKNGTPVKCILVKTHDEFHHFMLSVISNFNGDKHTVGETADAVRRIKDEGKFPWEDMTLIFGMSKITLMKYYDLSHLIPELKVLLSPPTPKEERLTISVGVELSRLPPAKQKQEYRRIKPKRADEATQHIRQSVDLAEKAGWAVRRNERGRQRKPSDDSKSASNRLRRIDGDLRFLANLGSTRVKAALAGGNSQMSREWEAILSDIQLNLRTFLGFIKAARSNGKVAV